MPVATRLLVCTLLLAVCLSVSVSGTTVTVSTPQGQVTGIVDSGVRSFLGVPFAAAPTGANRWRSPQAAANWTGNNTNYDATFYRPHCIQPANTPTFMSGAEDCLYLNVFTPDRDINSTALLPVLVYFYGGGFIAGSPEENPPAGFVRGGNGLVAVTLSYRLGPFGFFAHTSLSYETGPDNVASSGNFGFEDQRAALQWVKANIASYGGDPNQVTIGGESAGAISVCLHIVSPLSAGLFQRAFIESGGCDEAHSLSAAETVGQAMAQAFAFNNNATADCSGANGVIAQLACFRSPALDVPRIMGSAQAISAFAFFGPEALVPNIDGYNFIDFTIRMFATGNINKVDLLVGTNAAEMAVFLSPIQASSQFPAVTSAVVAQYAVSLSGNTSAIVNYYTTGVPSKFPTEFTAMQSLLSKSVFQCPTLRLARALKTANRSVKQYMFNYTSAFGAAYIGISGGAIHASELPYVFNTALQVEDRVQFPSTTAAWNNTADKLMSDSMRNYWIKFVETGDVNSNTALPGLPANVLAPTWNSFTQAGADALLFQYDGTIEMITNAYKTECDMWDAIQIVPPPFIPRINPTVIPGSGASSSTGLNAAEHRAPHGIVTLILIALAAWCMQW